jgi:hypothetical protein
MSEIALNSEASLSASIITRVDDACDRFEMGWKAGLRPRIEDYLAETVNPERAALLHDLLVLDLVYRRRQGDQPAPADYLARFPESVDLVIAVLIGEGCSCLLHDSLTIATRARIPSDWGSSDPDGTLGQHSWEQSRRAAWPEVAGYDILAELGHGGMGVVYQARQQQLNRLVALKMIRAGLDASPGDRDRFRVEAEAVARLRHANILQIYDIGEAAGLPFVALELLEGGTAWLIGSPARPSRGPRRRG